MGGEQKEQFASTAGVVFSCLGTVVGTGNIWRFPRIAAQNSGSQGTLSFLIIWIAFLFLWSSPMLLIEYVIGRYYKKSPIQSFFRAMGDKFLWCGAWVTSVTFFISCYYSIILGWCLYYLGDQIRRSIMNDIVLDGGQAKEIFLELTERSYWPVLFNGVAVLLAAAAVIGGIRWIETVNSILVPALLVIVVFTYCWSVMQQYGDFGIRFLFTPEWDMLTKPTLWVDAATQNAFDTGAALGLIVPYATYMTRKNAVVKYSILIPALNNVVSLVCAMTIFATVFSTLIQRHPTLSKVEILDIIQDAGPASTGLAFVWIPVLFGGLGLFGRILCPLFFLCLSFAGLSTVIADVEHTSLTLVDFGLPRRVATPLCVIMMFIIGLPSALSINIFENQDFIWGYALLISGIMFQALVLKVGYNTFRQKLVNNYSLKDWKLTHVHMAFIVVLAPIEAIALLVWWFYEEIGNNDAKDKWYEFGTETLMSCLVAWVALLALLMTLNFILYKNRPSWMNYNKDEEEEEEANEENNDASAVESKEMTDVATVDSQGQDNEAYTYL